MSRDSDLTPYPMPGMCDTSYISSCWQRLGTSDRAPGAHHSPMIYTMAGKKKTWRVYLLLANKASRRANPPNFTCLLYPTSKLLGSLWLECREPKA